MSYRQWLRHCPDVELTREQRAACQYLESVGLRFLIDFGYRNCEALMWARADGSWLM